MWVIFAVLNPIFDSLKGVFSKKASKQVDPLLVSWFNNLIPLIIFSPVLFYTELRFNYQFFEALFISGLINITATILYHRALFKGDISVVIPLLSFTPLFLLFLSPLILGEFPDTWGLIGTILIVAGSYLLNINLKKQNVFSPLKSLIKEKGTRYMLIVAFIWAISANFDKKGIEASSIYQYIFFINLFVSIGTTVFVFSKRKVSLPALKAEYKNLLAVGILTGAVFFVHMTAITLTLVVYVVSLKRTGGMISVFLGYFIFKEKNIRQRLLGSAIMFAGVLLIVLL
jgi:drug/metabolite transporter (DMT)-like permease